MKKSILLLILIPLFSGVLKAQSITNTQVTKADVVNIGTKPDTIKKKAPVYAPDLTTVHEVTIKGVTLEQLNNYLIFEQYGFNLDSSDKLSGAQITAIKKDALTVIQQISKGFSNLLAEDKSKWDKAQKTKP